MGPIPLVVLDTNVLVSAFGWEGPEREVYRLCGTGDLHLAVSDDLLAELRRVLGYPKFGLDRSEIEAVLWDVRLTGRMIDPDRDIQAIPDDPTDDRVLECALATQADWIVSGDRHLLDLDTFEGIPVVRAPELLRQVADGVDR